MIHGYIEIDQERCKGCELCEAVCPRQLIATSDRINRLGYRPAEFRQQGEVDGKWKGCTGCAVCGLICPDTAISVFR
ncbi:MAG TPA: 4Fe-4S dicluster domain-containing protein [Chloroflexota bacterium]